MRNHLAHFLLSLCLLLSACDIRIGSLGSQTLNFDQYLALTIEGKISKVTITDQSVTFERPFPNMRRHAFYYPFVGGLPYLPKLEKALVEAKQAGHTINVRDERVELAREPQE